MFLNDLVLITAYWQRNIVAEVTDYECDKQK